MSEHGKQRPSEELKALMNENVHLETYISEFRDEYSEYPIVVEEEEVGDYESNYPNILYQISDEVFVHIFGDTGIETQYYVVEPRTPDKEVLNTILNKLLKEAATETVPISGKSEDYEEYLDNLIEKVMYTNDDLSFVDNILSYIGERVYIPPENYSNYEYILHKNINGLGGLEPLLNDTNIEDIHIIGESKTNVDHGTYGLIKTDVTFGERAEFDKYLKNLGERINNPLSDSQPIVDATLPDGSRVNIVYSDDISIKGPSVTIRQGEEVPLSIFQITKWGTLSPRMAAYLWLCLENEQTVFVVGETASGKTTTLNSILTFISNDSKIYTAEDTAEVEPPQDTWQQLLTRESPDEASTNVEMFDLVAAALRARPDYIVVGEVRGEEARMAFQAAQTGHPVLLTFHASDIKSMIQRFTGEPLNVPETFIDNADVALFQNRVKTDDGDMLRRVTSVSEIIGYDDEEEGVISQEVFRWDSADDEHEFTGMFNSYVLEDQIAELLGYEDTRKIYDELDRRTDIIERIIEEGDIEYHATNEYINTIQQDGVEALSIDTSGLSKR